MNEIMTTKEVAEYLKLNVATVRMHAENQVIPAIRVGRVWRYPKVMIEQWLEDELKGGKREERRKIRSRRRTKDLGY